MNNVKIESDDNCIHSKPRKDVFKLKEELSLRIAAKRKEELKKKQKSSVEIPMEDSDSECDIQNSKGKEIESSCDVSSGQNKENYESDVEEHENGNISENGAVEGNDGNESNDENDEEVDDDDDEEVDEEGENDSDGCELVKTPKQRKRIIWMDNSDDDEESTHGK